MKKGTISEELVVYVCLFPRMEIMGGWFNSIIPCLIISIIITIIIMIILVMILLLLLFLFWRSARAH